MTIDCFEFFKQTLTEIMVRKLRMSAEVSIKPLLTATFEEELEIVAAEAECGDKASVDVEVLGRCKSGCEGPCNRIYHINYSKRNFAKSLDSRKLRDNLFSFTNLRCSSLVNLQMRLH